MVGRTERTIRGMRDNFFFDFSYVDEVDLSEKNTTDKKEIVKCDTKNAREVESKEK